MTRFAMIVVVMAITGACHGAADQAHARQAEPASTALAFDPARTLGLREFSRLIGAQCGDPDRGLDCVSGSPEDGDYQTVEMKPGCGVPAKFARIAVDGARLFNLTPPNDTVEVGKLEKGVRVCIQAVAREGDADGYYYVTPAVCSESLGSTTKKSCESGWLDAADVQDMH